MRGARSLGLGLLCLAACANPSGVGDEALAPGVTYVLVWEGQDLTVHPDGSWSVHTDLDYEVRVERGWLSVSAAQLVPCDDALTQAPAHGGVWALDWILGTSPARAGHGVAEADPSAVVDGVIEPLMLYAQTGLGPAPFASHDYCSLHVLFGPSLLEPAEGEIDLHHHVLHIEGTWERGEGGPQSFLVHTALPQGALVDLEAQDGSAVRLESGIVAARVHIERELGALFEGIDFAVASEDNRNKAILTALADGLEARVVATSAEPIAP